MSNYIPVSYPLLDVNREPVAGEHAVLVAGLGAGAEDSPVDAVIADLDDVGDAAQVITGQFSNLRGGVSQSSMLRVCC